MLKVGALVLFGCMLVGSIALYRIAIRYLQKIDKHVPLLGKVVLFIIMLLVSRLIIIGVLELFIVVCRIISMILS